MSEGLNRVMLLGNLGADPELRMTQGGQAVLNMRVATTESYLDKDRTRKERTDWHSVVVWGKRGEALAKILGKGSSLFIEGSIRTSSYEDRDGNKRYKTEIVANNVLLVGGKRERADQASEGAPRTYDDYARPPREERRAGRVGGAGKTEWLAEANVPTMVPEVPESDSFGSDDDVPF